MEHACEPVDWSVELLFKKTDNTAECPSINICSIATNRNNIGSIYLILKQNRANSLSDTSECSIIGSYMSKIFWIRFMHKTYVFFNNNFGVWFLTSLYLSSGLIFSAIKVYSTQPPFQWSTLQLFSLSFPFSAHFASVYNHGRVIEFYNTNILQNGSGNSRSTPIWNLCITSEFLINKILNLYIIRSETCILQVNFVTCILQVNSVKNVHFSILCIQIS